MLHLIALPAAVLKSGIVFGSIQICDERLPPSSEGAINLVRSTWLAAGGWKCDVL